VGGPWRSDRQQTSILPSQIDDQIRVSMRCRAITLLSPVYRRGPSGVGYRQGGLCGVKVGPRGVEYVVDPPTGSGQFVIERASHVPVTLSAGGRERA
jgi:hypothetical protein